MNRIALLILALTLSACAEMTPREKYWTTAAVGVLAVGAIAVYRANHRHTDEESAKPNRPSYCTSNPAACY